MNKVFIYLWAAARAHSGQLTNKDTAKLGDFKAGAGVIQLYRSINSIAFYNQ